MSSADRPLEGIKVVEVSMWGFVPSCGGVLADWGANVIKIEHARTGDPQRGLTQMGEFKLGNPNPAWEHPNRGKRSIGLDLYNDDGRAVLDELLRDADVFLTSFLPAARRKMRLEVDDIRAVNPGIIYARGSALGAEGPESEAGGYDATAFWARASTTMATTPRDMEDGTVGPPGPAYGDTISGTNLAGGIAAALVKKLRTGEPSVVDVSLLHSGVWSLGMGVTCSIETGIPLLGFPSKMRGAMMNPLVGVYKTSDNRYISLVMLQPFRYWEDVCHAIERPDLITDERFISAEALMANTAAGAEIVGDAIAKQPLSVWIERFGKQRGPWAPVQDSVQLLDDVQVRANGMILPVVDDSGEPTGHELVASPARFDLTSPTLRRAPEFAEHTELLLMEHGIEWDRIEQLKATGAIT